jgi:hypothetical protein
MFIPLQSPHHPIQILTHKLHNGSQGIGASFCIEIQRATHEIPGGVCQKKLIRGGCRALHIEYDSIYIRFRSSDLELIDIARFYIVLVGHIIGVFHEFIKFAATADGAIGAKNLGIQLLYSDIEPTIVFSFFIKKCGVVLNSGIYGLVKREAAVCFIKGFIGFFRINYPGIGARFGHRGIVLAAK